jgi:hypothetical protein
VSGPPPIDDDEYILRHIPDGSRWLARGPRITSANFELRRDRNETFVSVTRQKITSPEKLLTLVRSTAGSRVAKARVGDIRQLGPRVESKPSKRDGGHSGIESGTASLDDEIVRIKLCKLFNIIDPATYQVPEQHNP